MFARIQLVCLEKACTMWGLGSDTSSWRLLPVQGNSFWHDSHIASLLRAQSCLLYDQLMVPRPFIGQRSNSQFTGKSPFLIDMNIFMCALLAPQAALNPSLYKQSTNRVFMVAPTAFTYNAQAAEDNWYMSHAGLGGLGATGSSLTKQVSVV